MRLTGQAIALLLALLSILAVFCRPGLQQTVRDHYVVASTELGSCELKLTAHYSDPGETITLSTRMNGETQKKEVGFRLSSRGRFVFVRDDESERVGVLYKRTEREHDRLIAIVDLTGNAESGATSGGTGQWKYARSDF